MAISISKQDRLTFLSELGTLLAAGIPISEAIESLLKEAKNNQQKILQTLRRDLEEGKTISKSFARFPEAFDQITVSLIEAAEQSGTLDTTLKDLILSLHKEIDFDDRIRAAMAYPFMIVLVFFGVLTMILTFVVPRIASVFTRLKVTLPLPTKILIAISNFIMSYTPLVIGGIILFGVLIFILYKTRKKEFTNFLASLPFLSKIVREIDLARFTHSLALLLIAGIPITDALDLAKNVASKKEIFNLIVHLKEEVSSGKTLADGLKKSADIVPQTMIRITEAGEKSGNLEKSMEELSNYFDVRVNNTLKTITTLLEPILLVIIGLLVGGMMLAIIAPIYGLIGQIKGR